MRKIIVLALMSIFIVPGSALSQNMTAQRSNQQIQSAVHGCQKPIGFLPTPSKLMCMLTALGINDEEAKSKALAIIYSVCHGRTLQPLPAGTTAKAYSTLGACLSDPNAIAIINNELTAANFKPVKVVNPNVLNNTKK